MTEPDMILTFKEVVTVFKYLKKDEGTLSIVERDLFIKIEKFLYEHISVRDAENFLK
jgi:hypothetical protein